MFDVFFIFLFFVVRGGLYVEDGRVKEYRFLCFLFGGELLSNIYIRFRVSERLVLLY